MLIRNRWQQLTILSCITAFSLMAQSSSFRDDFLSVSLGPAWTVRPGVGAYSLTENAGLLRYSFSGSTHPNYDNPATWIYRSFSGDHWTLETRVHYSMPFGNGRQLILRVLLGDLSQRSVNEVRWVRDADINRDRILVDIFESGSPASFVVSRNTADTYYVRIIRTNQKLSLEMSSNGADYSQVAERTFSTILSPTTTVLMSGANFAGSGYAEYDYIAVQSHCTLAWGANDLGQLGNGTTTRMSTPVPVRNLTGVVSTAGGVQHSLALTSNGTVWAWGDNERGQLGNGNYQLSKEPVPVGSLTGVVAVTATGNFSMALKRDGTVWAWGDNSYGQLGNGGFGNSSNWPSRVRYLSGVVAIAAGGAHGLALKSNGMLWAWGHNVHGQLGNGSNTHNAVPVAVWNLKGIVGIAGGGMFSLALRSDGTVSAWGDNRMGQLGSGNNIDSNVPVMVRYLSDVATISASSAYHSLAITRDGTVWTWGNNLHGQLGNGSFADSNLPVPVLSGGVAVAGGDYWSLALKGDGTLRSWGWNRRLELGNGGVGSDLNVPVAVSNLTGALAIGVGGYHGLAVLGTGVPRVALNPKTADFGNQPIGSATTPQTITVTNTGGAGLQIKAVTLMGLDPGNFSKTADKCAGKTVNTGGSCSIGVKFAPRTVGSRSAAFLITSNAPGSPHLIPLSGTAIGRPASITVTTPNVAVKWGIGTQQQIKWNHTLGSGSFGNLDLSRNGGITWTPIAAGISNTGSFVWTVSGPATTVARVRVSWSANSAVKDISNVNFTIAAPFITVTKSNGGEQ